MILPAPDLAPAARPARPGRARRTGTLLLAALLAALAVPWAPPAATALEGQRERSIPVWPGVERSEWRLHSDGEPVHAQVVSIAPDAPVDFDLAFAHGHLPGLDTVPSMVRGRVDDGAVLGINGGFWRAHPWGRPDGFTARTGRLVAEAETQGDPDTGRGAFGVHHDRSMVVDRIRPQVVELDQGGQPVPATGVNRLDREGTARVPADGDDALYVITDQFASTATLPSGDDRGDARWRPIDGLTTVPRGTGAPGSPRGASSASPGDTLPVPAHGALLVGYGDGRGIVDAIAGPSVQATTSLEIDRPVPGRTAQRWQGVPTALTGGPHLLRADLGMTAPSSWEQEGFAPSHHGRQPRTAVGVAAGGTILLVTVDGRQPGHSVGLGTAETASFLRQLGAVEAVMLDGGGSTTMSQDTITVNRPSDGSLRPVANALLIQHRETFTATQRLSGAGREHTAAAIAAAEFPDGADHAVIAAGGDFPDALAGGPLAAIRDAPLLLANPGGISDVTTTALADLGVDRVTVLGGESAVVPAAVATLEAAGHRVDRIAGTTRFATAAAIAEQVVGETGRADRVVLASGLGFADALVAAAPAGMLETPILLAARDQLTGDTRAALASLRPREVVVVGGPAAISETVARDAAAAAGDATLTRLAGSTRFGTAKAINEWAEAHDGLDLDAERLIAARGDTFADALAGGPLAAQRGQLLVIVPPWNVRDNSDVARYLDQREARGLEQVTLLGGFAALSSYQQWQLEQLAGHQ